MGPYISRLTYHVEFQILIHVALEDTQYEMRKSIY